MPRPKSSSGKPSTTRGDFEADTVSGLSMGSTGSARSLGVGSFHAAESNAGGTTVTLGSRAPPTPVREEGEAVVTTPPRRARPTPPTPPSPEADLVAALSGVLGNNENDDEQEEKVSEDALAAAAAIASPSSAGDQINTDKEDSPKTKAVEEESQAQQVRMIAGGPGAAALAMGATAAMDTESDVSGGRPSTPTANYLPADLASTASGMVTVSTRASTTRAYMSDGSDGEGAIEAVTRDLQRKGKNGKGATVVPEQRRDEDSDSEDDENKRKKYILLAILCCLLLCAGILLAVLLTDDNSDSSDDPLDRSGDFIGSDDTVIIIDDTPTPTISPTFVQDGDDGIGDDGGIMDTFAPTLSPVEPLVPLPPLPGGIAEELFGSSLWFSNDGSTLAVGSLDGWAVYDSDSDDILSWTPRASPTTRALRGAKKSRRMRSLQANNGGSLVALSGNGNSVAVADKDGARVRVFYWNDQEWDRVGNVVTDFTLTANVSSLVVSESGNTLAVGGYGNVQAFRFVPGGDRWFPRGPPLLAGESSPLLGSKMVISADGRRIITSTSASGELVALEWNYDDNDWYPLGQPIPGIGGGPIVSLAASSDTTIVAFSSGGIVRVYTLVEDAWTQYGSDIVGSDVSFGSALAMDSSGLILIIGANESDEMFENAGEVRIYGHDGTDWIELYDRTYGAGAQDRWGTSVAISANGRVLAISADRKDLPTTGYVGLFVRPV